MNYVTLGKTGLKAAVVSFGGIPIQRADGANTKAVVDKLEEYGINYIDTARGYTVSEEYLGAALEGRRILAADKAPEPLTLQNAIEGLEAALSRL